MVDRKKVLEKANKDLEKSAQLLFRARNILMRSFTNLAKAKAAESPQGNKIKGILGLLDNAQKVLKGTGEA